MSHVSPPAKMMPIAIKGIEIIKALRVVACRPKSWIILTVPLMTPWFLNEIPDTDSPRFDDGLPDAYCGTASAAVRAWLMAAADANLSDGSFCNARKTIVCMELGI